MIIEFIAFRAYNIFATIIYPIYNGVLGAEEQFPVNAEWDETIPPEDEFLPEY
jgi:hypothetical protein